MPPPHKSASMMNLPDLPQPPPERPPDRQAALDRELYRAIFFWDLDRVEPLLASGANPFAIPEGSFCCALSVAACSSSWRLPPLAMFQALVAAGLPGLPEIGPTRETPLMFAARSSDGEAFSRVKLLLPHSEVDAVAADGFSALMCAGEAHNLEICALLAPLSNLSLVAADGRDIFTIIDEAARHYPPGQTADARKMIHAETERRLLAERTSPEDVPHLGLRGSRL